MASYAQNRKIEGSNLRSEVIDQGSEIMNCTYCGQEIEGKPVAPGYEGELVFWDGDTEQIPVSERTIGFCSDRCAWRYGMERHKAWGMTGKEARCHLVNEHGLTEPGEAHKN